MRDLVLSSRTEIPEQLLTAETSCEKQIKLNYCFSMKEYLNNDEGEVAVIDSYVVL